MKLKVAEVMDKKFPQDGLVGDLTKLKLFNESDITSHYLSWLNDPVVVRYSNQRFKFHTQESSLDYLASIEASDNLFISIQRRSDEKAIGTMTVYVSKHHGTADIGLLIGDRASWGNGLGLDAWNTISYWLIKRRNIRKITAGTLSGNVGMLKIFERSGMVKDGQRTSQELIDGDPMDIVYYARFRDDSIK